MILEYSSEGVIISVEGWVPVGGEGGGGEREGGEP